MLDASFPDVLPELPHAEANSPDRSARSGRELKGLAFRRQGSISLRASCPGHGGHIPATHGIVQLFGIVTGASPVQLRFWLPSELLDTVPSAAPFGSLKTLVASRVAQTTPFFEIVSLVGPPGAAKTTITPFE